MCRCQVLAEIPRRRVVMVRGIVITSVFSSIVLVGHSMNVAITKLFLQYSVSVRAVRTVSFTNCQASTGLCNDVLFRLKFLGGKEVPRIVDAARVEIPSGEGVSNELETQRRWLIWFNDGILYTYKIRLSTIQQIGSILTALSSIFLSSILVFENCSTLIRTTRFLPLAEAEAAGIGMLITPAVTLRVT